MNLSLICAILTWHETRDFQSCLRAHPASGLECLLEGSWPRQRFPWREFGFVGTTANAEPLFTGRFAELYAKIQPLDPYHSAESTRYTFYNACVFAWLCRAVPGDFLCGGISWGVAARLIYELLSSRRLAKPYTSSIRSTPARLTAQLVERWSIIPTPRMCAANIRKPLRSSFIVSLSQSSCRDGLLSSF